MDRICPRWADSISSMIKRMPHVSRGQKRTHNDPLFAFLGVREVAQMLGRSEGAVRQMVWRRQLPHRKVQGRVVFVRHEIETLIEKSPGVRLDEILPAGV